MYSMQPEAGGSWTRLLTAKTADDLAETFPTFVAKRNIFAPRYGPINKPDVISKWFASPQAPSEDVIVVIDPDNWLLLDISEYAGQVTPGHGMAERDFFSITFIFHPL